jgi:hypothetical protein
MRLRQQQQEQQRYQQPAQQHEQLWWGIRQHINFQLHSCGLTGRVLPSQLGPEQEQQLLRLRQPAQRGWRCSCVL